MFIIIILFICIVAAAILKEHPFSEPADAIVYLKHSGYVTDSLIHLRDILDEADELGVPLSIEEAHRVQQYIELKRYKELRENKSEFIQSVVASYAETHNLNSK